MADLQTNAETTNYSLNTTTDSNIGEHWPEHVDLVIELPGKKTILLPEVSPNETLNAIRLALADFQETAFLTSFKWEILYLVDVHGEKIEKGQELVNDFSELNSFIAPNVKKLYFKITEETYDAKKVRAHIKRLKEVSNRTSLVSAIPKDKFLAKSTTNEITSAPESNEVPSNEEKEKTNETKKISDTKAEALVKFKKLHEPVQIGEFYQRALIASKKSVGNPSAKDDSPKTSPLNSIVKSAFLSGWNPPPSNRRSQGDLLYLEVVLANEGTVYITATARGFYVNRSNRNAFDPRPATSSHYNHNLFNTLLSFSSQLRTAWANLCESSNNLTYQNQFGPLESLHNQLQNFDGDVISLPANTWVIEQQEGKNQPNYDLYRAQEYSSDLHGVEELGAPREWNDEIQSIRSLPANELGEKVVKARLEYKIIADFTENCKKVAVAISDGLIAPLTYADPNQSNIYVYNGIFVSRAEDIKDAFKLFEGEEASRKATTRDLCNQKLIKSLEIEGLGTVLITVVDYKGIRYVAQSIIPGIFNQGDNCAQLCYGVLEANKNITVKNSTLKLYQEIAKKLFIAERNIPIEPIKIDASKDATADANVENSHLDPLNKLLKAVDSNQGPPIKVDEVDNIPIDEVTQSIRHIGAVESKIIKGSDGRLYAIEFMRLTPRDANYVMGEKGTGKLSDELLQKGDTSLYVTYLLRQELLTLYTHRKINVARQALLTEAANKEKALTGNHELEVKASTESKEVEVEAVTKQLSEVTVETVEHPHEKEEEQQGEALQIVKEEDSSTKKEETPVHLDESLQNSLAAEYAEKFRNINVKSLELEVNVNVFCDFIAEINPDILAKDETLVREISIFLFDSVIPMVTKQIREGEFFPRDLPSMVHYLHRMGINLRYLGRLAKLAQEQEKEDSDLFVTGKQRIHSMPFYWLEFLLTEMIARSVKHILNAKLRNNALLSSAPAATIASLLNHVVSILSEPSIRSLDVENKVDEGAAVVTPAATTLTTAAAEEKKTSNKKKKRKAGHANALGTTGGIHDSSVSLESLLNSEDDLNGFPSRTETLHELAKTLTERFLYDFPLLNELFTPTPPPPSTEGKEDEKEIAQQAAANNFLRTRLSPTMLISRICQQSGIVLAAKNYPFRTTNTPFSKEDIIGLIPKVKSSEPDTYLPEFNEILNSSTEYLQQGDAVSAFDYAQQALNIVNQITGPNHLHVFQATDQLSAVLINSTDDFKTSITMASRSLLLAIQVYGLDSQESILHLLQLGILHSEVGLEEAALEYYQAAKYYLQLIAGDHHPELANIYMRMAALYEKTNDLDSALKSLFRARVYTADLMKSCMLTISIASLYYHHGYVHEAVTTQKNGYTILKELVKSDDERLIEVKKNLETYLRASSTLPASHRYPVDNVTSSSSQGGENQFEGTTNAGSGSPEGEKEEDVKNGTTAATGNKKKKNHKKANKAKK